jgi:hypothetical protein
MLCDADNNGSIALFLPFRGAACWPFSLRDELQPAYLLNTPVNILASRDQNWHAESCNAQKVTEPRRSVALQAASARSRVEIGKAVEAYEVNLTIADILAERQLREREFPVTRDCVCLAHATNIVTLTLAGNTTRCLPCGRRTTVPRKEVRSMFSDVVLRVFPVSWPKNGPDPGLGSSPAPCGRPLANAERSWTQKRCRSYTTSAWGDG